MYKIAFECFTRGKNVITHLYLWIPAMGRDFIFPECSWGIALHKINDAVQRVDNEREDYDGKDDPFSPT